MPKVHSYNTQNDAIKELLKIALVKKGWSQSHLAGICGLSDAQISKVFNQPTHCHFNSLQIVAKKLGIDSIPII